MMMIQNEFSFGDIVFLKTDKEQMQRIVTGILVIPIGLTYKVACGSTETWHYEMEMTSEKNILITATD